MQKITDQIATVGEENSSMSVKEEALYQISRAFRGCSDTTAIGDTHKHFVEGIRQIASSVAVKDVAGPEMKLVKDALEILGAYASGSSPKCVPNIQAKAREAIDFISATCGVEKFTELKK